MAASFDEGLVKEIGDCISTEGRAKYNGFQREKDYDIYKGLTYWSPNINIFRDVAELISHIALVDGDVLVFEIRRIEGEVFQDALQDRIEATGADVFGLGIHAGGDVGDGGEGVFGEGDVDAFGLEERGVLADEGLPRLGQNAAEVILGEA
mgnify:CR=1 FL=1